MCGQGQAQRWECGTVAAAAFICRSWSGHGLGEACRSYPGDLQDKVCTHGNQWAGFCGFQCYWTTTQSPIALPPLELRQSTCFKRYIKAGREIHGDCRGMLLATGRRMWKIGGFFCLFFPFSSILLQFGCTMLGKQGWRMSMAVPPHYPALLSHLVLKHKECILINAA